MPTTNLGQISAIHIGTTAPSNTKMMWYDDNVGQKILKYYDIGTTTWKSFDGVGVYLPIAGGTVTGFVTLHANPTANLHAATKQYVDSAVSGAGGTLAGVLTGANITGGTDIVISSGDTLNFSVGSGGNLTSASTTGSRTWTLPDVSGTLLLGTGTAGRVVRWGAGNSLTEGVLLDSGTTAGAGVINGSVLFNSEGTKAVALSGKSANTTSGIGVYGEANGTASGVNYGSSFGASGGASNYSAYGIADGGSVSKNAYGAYFESKNSEGIQVGSWGAVTASSATPTKAIGVMGSSTVAADITGANIAGAFILQSNGGTVTPTDFIQNRSAVQAYVKGTGITTDQYAGTFYNLATNSATNTGLIVSAQNGTTANYAIITAGGKSGFGVQTPTKMVEISNDPTSSGFITFNTAATSNYNFDISVSNSGARLSTSLVGRNIEISSNSVRLSTFLSTGGGLAVGPHTSVSSHLHVKYGGGLANADGSIRGTMSNNTPYVYATPALNNSLVLENEDLTANNSSVVVFRGKDTGGTVKNLAYMGALYHTRVGSSASADLIFGTAAANTISEAMRIHSTRNVSIGAETSSDRLHVLSDVDAQKGIVARQDNTGTNAKSFIQVASLDSGTDYTIGSLISSATGSVGSGTWTGEQKYFEKAVHLISDGVPGAINIYARGTTSPFRLFTGGLSYSESNLRLTVDQAGKFGFNLAKAGYTGTAVDTQLSDFHVGTGALFQATGTTAGDTFIVQSHESVSNQGGLVITNSSSFAAGTSNVGGFKFVSNNTGSGTALTDDELTFGLVSASAPSTFVNSLLYFNNGKVGVGEAVANEMLTVGGVVSLKSTTNPTATTGYGKVFVKSDNDIYFLKQDGVEYKLNQDPGLTGPGVQYQVAVYDTTTGLIGDSDFTWDGTTLTVTGDLVVSGTTTTVNSTTVTIKDPVFTIGDDAVNDAKDRGIEFKYNAGGAKVGFFGHDDSLGRFTYIKEATNTAEVFSGTPGDVMFGTAYLSGLNLGTGSVDTYFMTTDGSGAGSWGTINDLVIDSTPVGTTDFVMVWDASANDHKKVLLSVISAGASHNLLDGVTHPDTQAAVVQRGDLVVGKGSTAKWDRLAKGTASQYLKSDGTDLLWGTIDISEVANAIDGSGTLNQVAYWSDSDTLTSSANFIFDGSNASLFGATVAGSGLHINDPGSSKTTALSVNNFANSAGSENYGVLSSVGSGGAYDAIGVYGLVTTGGSTTQSIGIYGKAVSSSAGVNIGGKFQVSNSGSGAHYSLQLIDGNEGTTGRFFKNVTTVGQGQWADVVLADVTDVTATAAEVNLLDLAGLTTGHVLAADSATTASWRKLLGSEITNDVNFVNGSGAANQLAYFTDSDTLASSSSVTWNGAKFQVLKATQNDIVQFEETGGKWYFGGATGVGTGGSNFTHQVKFNVGSSTAWEHRDFGGNVGLSLVNYTTTGGLNHYVSIENKNANGSLYLTTGTDINLGGSGTLTMGFGAASDSPRRLFQTIRLASTNEIKLTAGSGKLEFQGTNGAVGFTKFTDTSSVTTGIQYSANYGTFFTDRSLIDKGFADGRYALTASGLANGDKGDITVSGTGSDTWTIDNDVVTFAKMQNVNTSSILGRYSASSGDVEQLSIGTGLNLSGGGDLTADLSGSGAGTRSARFTGTSVLGTGSFYDNGTKVSIGINSMSGTNDASLLVSGSVNDASLYVQNTCTSGLSNGIEVLVNSNNNNNSNYGIWSRTTNPSANGVAYSFIGESEDVASNSLTVLNGSTLLKNAGGIFRANITGTNTAYGVIGIAESLSAQSNATYVGGRFIAKRAGANYALQLDDSSQAVGKYLRCVSTTGYALWQDGDELTKSLYLEDPTATDDIGMWEPGVAITITKVVVEIIGSGTIDFNIGHSSNQATDLFTSEVQATTTKQTLTSFADASCNAANYIHFQASAKGGSPSAIKMTITYTE